MVRDGAAAALFVALACTEPDVSGNFFRCNTNADCLLGETCVQVGPNAQGCQVIAGLEEDPSVGARDSAATGGEAEAPGAGGAATESAVSNRMDAGDSRTGLAGNGCVVEAAASSACGETGGLSGSEGDSASLPDGGTAARGRLPVCSAALDVSDGEICEQTCLDDCGVFKLGTRVCECGPEDGLNIVCDEDVLGPSCFECAQCDFAGVNDPLLVPPDAPLTDCTLEDAALEDDLSGCEENQRCQSIREGGQNRYCGCRSNLWDCDSKPDSFRF